MKKILFLVFVTIISCQNKKVIKIDTLPKPNFYFENGMVSTEKLKFSEDSVAFLLRNTMDTSSIYKKIYSDLKHQIPNIDKINFTDSLDFSSRDSTHILVCGIISEFINFNDYNFPITQIANGFNFGNTDFTDASDGIYLETDNCILLIGNSYAPLEKIMYDRWFKPYQYFIASNNEIIGFGNLKDNKFYDSLYCDLKEIRKTNYTSSFKSDLIKYHISYRFNFSDSLTGKLKNIDSLLISFINSVKLKPIEDLIPCFIHFDQDEIQIAGGYPLPGEISGRVNDNILHVLGFNFDVIIHESVHKIFDGQVGKPINTFFNEGVPKYWEFKYNSGAYKDAQEIMQAYDSLDYYKIITGEIEFWNTPEGENELPIAYDIAGSFVYYLN